MDVFSIIAISIYAMFAFVFLVGFLRGLRKGLYKSMVDVVIVLLSAALSVFVVKLIAQMLTDTNMILNIITKIQDSVGEGDAYDVFESIKQYIASAPADKDIVGGVMSLPVAIIAPFLFMIVYPVLGLIIKIPKLIIESVALGPNGGDDYRGGNRLCGGLVGGVRLFISIAIFFVPIFGYINLADTVINSVATTRVEVVEADDNASEIELVDAEADEKKESSENGFADAINSIADSCSDVRKDYTEPIASNFIIKAVNTCGGKWMFNSLTTTKVSTHRVSLTNEITAFTDIYKEVAVLGATPTDKYAEKETTAISNITASFDKTTVVPYITSTALSYTAERWLAGEEVFGFPKILVGDEWQGKVDSILITLSKMNPDTIKEDVHTVADVFTLCINEGLFKEIANGDALTVLEKETFFEPLFLKIYDNERTRPILPDVSNTIMEYLYDLYNEANGTDLVYSDHIDYKEISREEMGAEGARIAKVIRDIKYFAENTELEVEDVHSFLANTDVHLIGGALDDLRESLLFGGERFKFIAEAFLRSEAAADLVFSDESLIQVLLDDSASIEKVLVTRQQVAIIALALEQTEEEKDRELYENAIKNLLTDIDPGSAELLKNTMSKEALEDFGMPKEDAENFSQIFSSVVDVVAEKESGMTEEEAAAEIETVDKLLTVVNKATESSADGLFSVNEGESSKTGMTADDFVGSIVESDVMSSVIKDSATDKDGNQYVFTGVTREDSETVKGALQNYYTSNQTGNADADAEMKSTLDAIGGLFGVDTSTIYGEEIPAP